MISERDAWAATPKNGFVGAYVTYAAHVSHVPIAYQLGAALGALAPLPYQTIGLSHFGSMIHPTVYVLFVGDSGDGKTHAMSMVEQVMRGAGMDDLIGDDPGSEEGFLASLKERPRQVVMWGEFATFLEGTKEGSYKSALRHQVVSAHDCRPMSRRLAKRENSTVVAAPRFSCVAGCTPSHIDLNTTEGDWLGGLMGRFLLVSSQQQRSYPASHVVPGAKEAQNHLIYLLAQRRRKTYGQCVGVDPGALAYLDRWSVSRRAHWEEGHLPISVGAAVRRLIPQACRIAMLYSMDFGNAFQAPERTGWTIGRDEMAWACAFLDLHIPSYITAVRGIVRNQHERLRRDVLRMLIRPDGHWTPRTEGQLLGAMTPRVTHDIFGRSIKTLVQTGDVHLRSGLDGASYYFPGPVPEGVGGGIPAPGQPSGLAMWDPAAGSMEPPAGWAPPIGWVPSEHDETTAAPGVVEEEPESAPLEIEVVAAAPGGGGAQGGQGPWDDDEEDDLW